MKHSYTSTPYNNQQWVDNLKYSLTRQTDYFNIDNIIQKNIRGLE